MSWSFVTQWIPGLRRYLGLGSGRASVEVTGIEDRLIADMGLLWCDIAYGGDAAA